MTEDEFDQNEPYDAETNAFSNTVQHIGLKDNKMKIGQRSYRYHTSNEIKWYRNINDKSYVFAKYWFEDNSVEFHVLLDDKLIHQIVVTNDERHPIYPPHGEMQPIIDAAETHNDEGYFEPYDADDYGVDF